MKSAFLCAAAALLLAACAGDNNTTRQSPGAPSRTASSQDVKVAGRGGAFSHGRVYRIERLDNAESSRGEWRALGETIRQNGSTIEFTELGTGKTISFTAPHQVTATNSRSD